MGKRFLITGGEAFIGRNLRVLLEGMGQEVKILDITGNPDYSISVTTTEKVMNNDQGSWRFPPGSDDIDTAV